MSENCTTPDRSIAFDQAMQVANDAWEELQRSPFVQRQLGTRLARLPDLSLTEARRRAGVGDDLLRRLRTVDQSRLPRDMALCLRAVRFRSEVWAKEADWYELVTDPLGIGYFGLFLPSAYCGGFFLNVLNSQLSSYRLSGQGDADCLLDLIRDYPGLIDQLTERTQMQARRGIRMPKAQVQKARALIRGLKAGAGEALRAAAFAPGALDGAATAHEIIRIVSTRIEPAFDRMLGCLSDDYLSRAPDEVGCGQYPGGPEVYSELVKFHTTLPLTPAEVNSLGMKRLREIDAQKAAIRAELNFVGDDDAFRARLNHDPAWRSSTQEEVKARFEDYIGRAKRLLAESFSDVPRAGYGVAPLPKALEGSMTFGYFDPPTKDRPEGIYRFNAHNLTRHPLFALAGLTFHELVPGHHLQIALQYENRTIHPFQQYSFVTAYNEGWAEYAATLAGESGLYQPEEHYGRLLNEGFLTSRLVVDTGMNALGWSMERSQAFMREQSALSDSEIETECLRYSCDMPGQALAYKLGDTEILALRRDMQQAFKEKFSLKHFHQAVLGSGALPLPDLRWHLEASMRAQ